MEKKIMRWENKEADAEETQVDKQLYFREGRRGSKLTTVTQKLPQLRKFGLGCGSQSLSSSLSPLTRVTWSACAKNNNFLFQISPDNCNRDAKLRRCP